ncbi:MAG: hypothetical protein IKN20_06355 [Firmicutes bacterium]|nr:hypothetical protein [Bacillota bacterium]
MTNHPQTEEKRGKSKNNGLRRALSLLVLPLTFAYLEWRLAADCALANGYHPGTALLAGFAFGMLCNC